MREVILHMHSPAFRTDFYPLVRNDQTHIRLFSLHLFLLQDRLKHSVPQSFFSREYIEWKRAIWILSGRRFPTYFYE